MNTSNSSIPEYIINTENSNKEFYILNKIIKDDIYKYFDSKDITDINIDENNIIYYHILIIEKYDNNLQNFIIYTRLTNDQLNDYEKQIEILLKKIVEINIFCGDINLRNILIKNNKLVLNDFDNNFCCSDKQKIQKCIDFDKDMYILLIEFIILINSKRYLLKPLFYNQLLNKFRDLIKFI